MATSLVRRDTEVAFAALNTFLPHIRSGELRVLAIANDKWKVALKQEVDPETKQSRPVWDTSVKDQRFDYPAADAVIGAARTLYPDSAVVSDNVRRLTDEKNVMISSLNDQFTDHVDRHARLVRRARPRRDDDALRRQRLDLRHR